MIKTLRITSIVATILAAILLVFPVIFGVRSGEDIEELLKSPGVIEKFNEAVGNNATRSRDETSPLVQQAGAFALYLNPPTPKASKTLAGRGAPKARGPAVTPKFTVLGTSYYEGRPESSLVLIDEPGKGLHWVRQSGKIGHLLIEQIKDGLIVVKDNGRTYEVAAEQKPETSLLEGSRKRAFLKEHLPVFPAKHQTRPTPNLPRWLQGERLPALERPEAIVKNRS